MTKIVEKRNSVRKERLIAGQINISKMSLHSEVAVDKFIADHGIKLLAVQETGSWTASAHSFNNMRIIQNKTNTNDNPDLSGVALLVDKTLYPEHIDALDDDDIDGVWAQIKVNGRRILVGSVYCRPGNSGNNSDTLSSLKQLTKHIEKVLEYKDKYRFTSILIYGDYNARHIDWGDHKSERRGALLKEFVDQKNLTMCSPFDRTFVCENGGSVIDLLLAQGNICTKINTQWLERESELFTGAPRRGHYPVLHEIHDGGATENVREVKVDWMNADWEKWSEHIERKVQDYKDNQSIEDGELNWKYFLDVVKEATALCVPTKIISIHSRPFWNDLLTRISNTAREARMSFQNRSTPTNRELLNKIVKEFRDALTQAKNAWIRKRAETLNITNSQQFWKRYKKVFGVIQDNYINNLTNNQGLLCTTDKEKEALLHDTFFTGKHMEGQRKDKTHQAMIDSEYTRISREAGLTTTPAPQDRSSRHNIDTSEVNEDDTLMNDDIEVGDIEAAIKKQQSTDKAVDPDGIHPAALKKLGKEAKELLKKIFNWCLRTGSWIWKESYVIFIRKADKKSYSNPGAYRPITISSYFGKILERIKDSRIRLLMFSTGQLDEDQEGFLQSRSTSRYLFRLLANLNEIKRKKMACLLLFIDFQKAFDSVYIPGLIVKLKNLGVSGNMLKMIETYLIDRKIQLQVNKFKGPLRKCGKYGLPQGSSLSPILFIIYIMDMVQGLAGALKNSLSFYKFADDGTAMICADTMIECHTLMQLLCDHLTIWCRANQLVLNLDINKTEAIILQTKNTQYGTEELPPKLKLDQKEIQYVHQTKALGLIIDENLSFKTHAEEKLKSCNKAWGNLTKSTNRNHGLNVHSLTTLLKTIVLTKLHYVSPLWLGGNIDTFKGFWNSVIMKISGSMLNPHREVTELALHLPPIYIQLKILSIKFLCKCLTAGDHMTSLVLQVEGMESSFTQQIHALKEFLQWKSGLRSAREVCLLENEHVFYNKSEIEAFQTRSWLDYISNRCQVRSRSSEMDNVITEMISTAQEGDRDIRDCPLNGKNSLFRFETCKGLDSFLMDYIHGNCFTFGNVRASVSRGAESNMCYFCNATADSPTHQLLHCEEVADNTQSNLCRETAAQEEKLLKELLFPTNNSTQRRFIERVSFLKDQHEFIAELKEED